MVPSIPGGKIKIRPKWGWNIKEDNEIVHDFVLKSDQNGVEILFRFQPQAFAIQLKSDQNGVEMYSSFSLIQRISH